LTNKVLTTIPKQVNLNSFPVYSCYDVYVLSKLGYSIKGVTNNFCVEEFWKCFKANKSKLFKIANKLLPSVNHFTYPLIQKKWTTYNDPFIRSAYFFLLANLSTLGVASTGALQKEKGVEMDFSHIDEKVYGLHKPEKGDINRENTCTLINCNTFNIDILSQSEGAAIDQTKLNGPKTIEKYRKSYEPWIIGFNSDIRIEKHTDSLNLYFYDHLGQPTSKESSRVYLVSNV
jgi:hypothetical protein